MPDQLVCSQEVTGAFSKFKGLEFKLYNFTIKKKLYQVCVCAREHACVCVCVHRRVLLARAAQVHYQLFAAVKKKVSRLGSLPVARES